ncbi:hypothetical protein GF337_13975, partial [candidate division KSB1 bacterium]|nr:hypothetical protein [candidate division KSB1 bacterium]
MKELIFFERTDCLTQDDALYWKDLLYRVIKVGTELEYALPQGVKKKEVLPKITDALLPTNNINQLGRYGVLDVENEHCGFEIRVIGRQPYYKTLLNQYQHITSVISEFGVRTKYTCGLHYHLLAIGLNECMPEIILANFWNLVRRYAPSLKFMTSTGSKREALCRRRNHNSHLEMIRLCPGVRSMKDIQGHLNNSKIVPKHQNFFNLEHLEFSDSGDVSKFHVEFRFPDANLSAISVVAKIFLFLSMLIKSVEISQFGLIHVGRTSEWKRKMALLDMLSNNDGDLASSDTSKIADAELGELRAGSRELLGLLKPLFVKFDNNPCFSILSFLAETPVSLLRMQGYSWKQIETTLQKLAEKQKIEWDVLDRKIIRVIELSLLTGQKSVSEW